MVKKVKSKMAAKKINGCDGRLMVKILIMTIQVNLVPLDHHSHFLAAILDFTSFFTIAFLMATLFFFYSLAVLD